MPRPNRALATIIKAARMRYEGNLSQGQIAKSLGVSAATVSRYLAQAVERGLIEVRVVESAYRDLRIERELQSAFGLEEAVVVQTQESSDATLRVLGSAAGRAIVARIAEGAMVGVSNGDSMAALTAEMPRMETLGTDVVTLIGGVGQAEEASHTAEICRQFAQATGGRARVMPLPALLDSEAMLDALRGSEAFRVLNDLYARLDIAVVGIGSLSPESSTVRDGLFSAAQLAQIAREGGVGTICARFVNAQGEAIPVFEDRTISITFEQLRNVPVRVGIALGTEKIPALRAALTGRLVTALATDTETARLLLSEVAADA